MDPREHEQVVVVSRGPQCLALLGRKSHDRLRRAGPQEVGLFD